jgi:electron transfer flavoprotein beta subunit
MKILVAIKRVLDANVRVRLRADNTGVDLTGLRMSMNPFDENALEEAVRLREAGMASSVTVVTIGPAEAVDVLRTAYAMGADAAIHVKADAPPEPLAVAKILEQLATKETADLVMLGKQSIDGDNNQSAQMLAARLDWPQSTAISKITIAEAVATLEREVDGGIERLTLALPAVVSADLRLNTPRTATLPMVMKARAKPITTIELAELGISPEPRHRLISLEAPASTRKHQALGSVAELAQLIKQTLDATS